MPPGNIIGYLVRYPDISTVDRQFILFWEFAIMFPKYNIARRSIAYWLHSGSFSQPIFYYTITFHDYIFKEY